MKRLMTTVMALALASVSPFGAVLRAQADPPVASKQELARTKFQELTARMAKLQEMLSKTDPEQSKLIQAGIQFVQEKKIHDDMARIRQLLDDSEWDKALTEMQETRKELTQLLELLQNRNLDLQKLLEQIAQMQKFRDQVDKLAKEQKGEKEDSARTEDLQKHLKDLQAAKERAESLLAQQTELRETTNQLGLGAAAEATKPLADKEGQLKEDTDKLAAELAKLEQKAAELQADAAEASKPGEAKPGENKPGEARPGEAKPGEGKPSESKPGAGAPGQPGKGSSSAGQAAKAMQQAQNQLGDNRPESSLKDQDQAIEKLQQTVEEIEQLAEQARRELEKLPFELQAKKQEQTQHATDTLSKEMEKAEESGDNGEGKPTPGRKNVQQAVPKQKNAAGSLKEYKPAKQKQQDAQEDLERARDELDEALAQLRQQLQDEVLRALEERFTAMLAKQRELSVLTKVLDKSRAQVLTADSSLPASLVDRIQGVASGEQSLEVEASDALKLLEEEGSTAVFPEIVTDLQGQLREVAKECRQNLTGLAVQEHQREIEDTLELLINALRRTIEKRDNGQC
jgi:chromosome segregation ATPase